MQFSALPITEPILKAIAEEGYTTPTPIQLEAIPLVLKGNDLLACAQTGTGKTAAFSIPILQLLMERKKAEKGEKRRIRGLILTPTRELAIQIGESLTAYGRHTGIRNLVIFGGVNQNPQADALRRGTDILVATPGRLLDLMNQGHIHLHEIEYFVLDEADRMLDMGFIHDVRKILKALPQQKQSLFFSATMPGEIVNLADTILHHPSKVTVTPVSSTAEIINQFVLFVDKGNKIPLLVHLLQNPEIRTALVFTRTKYGADKVARHLRNHNITAEAIHGNKTQNARQRALQGFKSQEIRVLVATDIAARGIDVDELAYVFNFDMSNIAETYVHRIGRTGRAGAEGTAYSFCDSEEKAYLRDVEKLIAKKIPVLHDHPWPMTGETHIEEARQEGHGRKGHQTPKPSTERGKRQKAQQPAGRENGMRRFGENQKGRRNTGRKSTHNS